jgi:hypothetical protein
MGYGIGYPDVLSEKAKGKQRAVDPPTDIFEGQTSSQPLESSRDLIVRFTEGSPDLTISVEKDDTVRHIKRRVSYLIKVKDKQVKLTYLLRSAKFDQNFKIVD